MNIKNRVGEERYNNQNLLMKIIEYYGANHMDVLFEDGYIAKNVTYQNFKKGNILNHNIKQIIRNKYKIGEIKENYQGCKMQLLKYNNCRNIVVKFLDEYSCIVNTTYKTFKNGKVRNPYYPSIYGVGIIGNIHKVPSKEYYTWTDMLKRCFCKRVKEKQKAYEDVTCCEEWLLFDNFYNWLHSQENFNQWYNGEKWCIDKDILIKNNKIYSPRTCCLTSNKVNCLFERNKSTRGDLPIGVNFHKATNKYQAACKNGEGKTIYLGIYNNYEDAFMVYKKQKEKVIKQVAIEEYKKGNVTTACYTAMMQYEVEITD